MCTPDASPPLDEAADGRYRIGAPSGSTSGSTARPDRSGPGGCQARKLSPAGDQLAAGLWLTKLVMVCHRQLMAESLPLNEVKTRLSELVRRVEAGEEIVIRRGSKPVARLVREPEAKLLPPGALGIKVWMADDFDDPLPEFEEYMGEDPA